MLKMARRTISHASLMLFFIVGWTTAIPNPFYGLGLAGYGGKMGYGNPASVGISYRGRDGGAPDTGVPAPEKSPALLTGLVAAVQAGTNVLVEGTAVTIQPAGYNEYADEKQYGGLYGAGLTGFGGGYGGGYSGGYGGGYSGGYGGGYSGGYGGGYSGGFGGGYGGGFGGGFAAGYAGLGPAGNLQGLTGGGRQQGGLEALIELMLKPDFAGPKRYLVVFTENAFDPNFGGAAGCPKGPVMTGPNSLRGNSFGNGYGGYGGGFGFGYGAGNGLMGAYGGLFGLGGEPDFGIIAEINVNAGINTFKIQGLGAFTDISQLAGRGLAICKDVVIGPDGRPHCSSAADGVFTCLKLGYNSHALSLSDHQEYHDTSA